MFVAWMFLATANVAAITSVPAPPSRDFSKETAALLPLLEQDGRAKPLIISTPEGVAFQLQWWAPSKTGDCRVQLDTRKSHPMLESTPYWAEPVTVKGFEGVRAKPGATRSGSTSVAGYWVWAAPYVVQVDIDPSPDGARVWDSGQWASNDAKARAKLEEALRLLGEAGLITIAEEKTIGALTVTAQSSSGGIISGLKVHLSVPGQAEQVVVTTDSFGNAKSAIPIKQPDKDLAGQAVACTYTQQTKVGGVPLRLVTPLKLEFTTPFKLTKAADFRGTVNLRFFVRPIYVKVEYSDSSDPVTDCMVSVIQGEVNGQPIIRAFARDAVSSDADGIMKLLMPVSRTNGGQPATVLAAQTIKGVAYEGWESITLPSNTIESATALIELSTTDLPSQFRRYQARLRETLVAAGFTAEEVQQILAVRLRMGAGNNYLNGIITMAQGSTLRSSSENLLHEFGHLISDVVAPDEPEGVGMSREGGGPTNPVTAWDEGRAHLYSSLLGRALALPGAKPVGQSPAAYDDCARREEFVHRALVEYYGNRTLFPNPAAALADFRDAHERGQAQLGRPPRTMAEFLNAARAGATPAQRQNLDRIRQDYRFGQ